MEVSLLHVICHPFFITLQQKEGDKNNIMETFISGL